MESYKGILSQYKLWSFWDNLPEKVKKSIIDYFEKTPLMFDYKHLFEGNWRHPKPRTPISVIETLFVCDDLETCDLFFSEVCNNQFIHKTNSWYWVDLHFFLSNYTKKVYKHFYNNRCSEKRFLNSCYIEYNSNDLVCDALKNKNLFPVRNVIFEQFLIYLEKRKEFNKVIEYAVFFKSKGWTNDFDKRIIRNKKKLDKK